MRKVRLPRPHRLLIVVAVPVLIAAGAVTGDPAVVPIPDRPVLADAGDPGEKPWD